MKLKYNLKADPLEFKNELDYLDETFRVLYFDNYVIIEFFDLRELRENIYSENEELVDVIIKYEKKHFEVIIEDGEECQVEIWETYNFDIENLNQVVADYATGELTPTKIRQLRAEAFKELDIQQLGGHWDMYTDEEKAILAKYLGAWLDAPETRIIPIRPKCMK